MGEVRVAFDGRTSSRPKLLSFLYSRQIRFATEQCDQNGGRNSSIMASTCRGLRLIHLRRIDHPRREGP